MPPYVVSVNFKISKRNRILIDIEGIDKKKKLQKHRQILAWQSKSVVGKESMKVRKS
jgi:hypothetical protein